MNSVGVVWLASYPKSGNTWIRMFLESYWIDQPVDINKTKLVVSDSAAHYTQIISPRPLGKMEPWEQWFLRPAAMYNLLLTSSFGHPIVKTHCANVVIEGAQIIPSQLSAAGIYIVRDPRDVVISWSEQLDMSIDETIEVMANKEFGTSGEFKAADFLGSWSDHVGSWSKTSYEMTYLRYEDLLKGEGFKEIIRAVGWEYDEERFKRAKEASKFKQLKRQEEKEGFVEKVDAQEQFFKRGTAGHWRNVLTSDQVRRIERVHGEIMARNGYVLSEAQAA